MHSLFFLANNLTQISLPSRVHFITVSNGMKIQTQQFRNVSMSSGYYQKRQNKPLESDLLRTKQSQATVELILCDIVISKHNPSTEFLPNHKVPQTAANEFRVECM